MKLPGAEFAVVDISKLRDYCLDPFHPIGKHKAHIFAAVLSIVQSDAEFLRQELRRAAGGTDVIVADKDEYGQRYIIDFELARNDRRALVRSAWIILHGENFPRLTTCYVLLK
jgi:hypothetical protein